MMVGDSLLFCGFLCPFDETVLYLENYEVNEVEIFSDIIFKIFDLNCY